MIDAVSSGQQDAAYHGDMRTAVVCPAPLWCAECTSLASLTIKTPIRPSPSPSRNTTETEKHNEVACVFALCLWHELVDDPALPVVDGDLVAGDGCAVRPQRLLQLRGRENYMQLSINLPDLQCTSLRGTVSTVLYSKLSRCSMWSTNYSCTIGVHGWRATADAIPCIARVNPKSVSFPAEFIFYCIKMCFIVTNLSCTMGTHFFSASNLASVSKTVIQFNLNLYIWKSLRCRVERGWIDDYEI
jgi:hypothetical protein